jgi:hypothetical protein
MQQSEAVLGFVSQLRLQIGCHVYEGWNVLCCDPIHIPIAWRLINNAFLICDYIGALDSS